MHAWLKTVISVEELASAMPSCMGPATTFQISEKLWPELRALQSEHGLVHGILCMGDYSAENRALLTHILQRLSQFGKRTCSNQLMHVQLLRQRPLRRLSRTQPRSQLLVCNPI